MNDDKIEKEYTCGWCGYVFKQWVGSLGGGIDQQGRKLKKISDQVKCPMCYNFLKTWG